MDNFVSKASSYLSSQADHQGALPNKEEEQYTKPASSGGYGDLLAGAQLLMQGATKPSGGESTSTDGYGNLLAGAQALMNGAAKTKPTDHHGVSMNEEAHKFSSSGDQTQALSKPSGNNEDVEKMASSAGYGDLAASAQVLMQAAKARDKADMGEVAGAAANLIAAAAQYGNLEKTSYGEYANKAQAYLHDYQASHGKPAVPKQDSAHQSPSLMEGKEEGSAIMSEEARRGAPQQSSW